jgi:tyrosine-protein phosphatase YwqE
MFWFKKKQIDPIDLSWLATDMHSHLIPGIDDGAPDLETSIDLIKGLVELGYKKIITTPHVLWEIYPNTSEKINSGLKELKKAVAKEKIRVEISAGAEYFIDEYFEEQLRKKQPLLTISGNMVLVEFSMVTAPMDLQQVIFDMQMQDYQPVLAHPERYTYLNRKRDLLDDLKTAGCLFQLNLLSLTGYYGDTVLELAEDMVHNNYYDMVGTDLHHHKHLEMLQKLGASPLYQQLRTNAILRNKVL